MKTKKKKTKAKARVTKPKARVKTKAKKKVVAKKRVVAKKKVKKVVKVKAKPKAKAKKRRGFTLIEMLIVVAIIGVLATVVLVAVTNARKKSNATQAKAVTSQIAQAVEMYKANGCSGSATITWPGTGGAFTDCNGEILIARFPSTTFSGGITYTASAGATYNAYTLTVSGFSAGTYICSNGSCGCNSDDVVACTRSN